MMDSSPVRRLSEEKGLDPILERVARTNTFDSDWPTLQHHMSLALTSAISSFLSTPSSSQPPATPTRAPISSSAQSVSDSATEATPPPIASPSAASSSPITPTLFSRFAPAGASPSSAQSDRVDPPSTPGGLVLPPFPPREPRQKRRGSLGLQKGGGQGSPTSAGPSIASVRVNGHPPVPMRSHPLEDDWDEDVAIGGKQLPGKLEEEDAKKEAERLVQMLEDFREPPFTIQRLAELLSAPFSQHTSTGKYLRAIEKLLLVNTSWEAPSYIPVTVNSFSGDQPIETSASSSTSPATFANIESTMPPRSMTPMFSPITFGQTSSDNPFSDDEEVKPAQAAGHGGSNGAEGANANGRIADRLMSPLTLGGGRGEDVDMEGDAEEQGRLGNGIRSPAPEPEEGESASSVTMAGSGASPSSRLSESAPTDLNDKEAERKSSPYTDSPRPIGRTSEIASSSSTSAAAAALASSTNSSTPSYEGTTPNDPAHQPYLGRVDELDTGPIPTPAATASGTDASDESSYTRDSHSPDSKRSRNLTGSAASSSVGQGGTGEGGTMTPHGMSERPVPLSSTTEIEKVEERATASLPRRASMANLRAAAEADDMRGQDGDSQASEQRELRTEAKEGHVGESSPEAEEAQGMIETDVAEGNGQGDDLDMGQAVGERSDTSTNGTETA